MCHLQTSGCRVRQHIGCVNDVFSTHVEGNKVRYHSRTHQDSVFSLMPLIWLLSIKSDAVDNLTLWKSVNQNLFSTFKHISGCRTANVFQTNYEVSHFLPLLPIFLIRLIKSGCKPAINPTSAPTHWHHERFDFPVTFSCFPAQL